MTADRRDDKDIKNNSRGKMQLAICWSGISHMHHRMQKSNYSSHIVIKFIGALLRHSCHYFIRKLSAIMIHSIDLLMSPDKPTRVWHFR